MSRFEMGEILVSSKHPVCVCDDDDNVDDVVCARKELFTHFLIFFLFALITGATVVSWRVNNQEQLFVR